MIKTSGRRPIISASVLVNCLLQGLACPFMFVFPLRLGSANKLVDRVGGVFVHGQQTVKVPVMLLVGRLR